MCKAFSCLVHKNKKVYWKFAVDNHHTLVEKCKWRDNTNDPARMRFARIEIVPKNKNYLFPDEWMLQVDERIKPYWFSPAHEEVCFDAHKLWLKELNKYLIKKPIIHPLKDIKPPKQITKEIVKLLKNWNSVRDSVRDSVGDSIGDSVGDSVGDFVLDYVWDFVWDSVEDFVWDSVGDSIGDSVGDSVMGYIGSFFKLEKWKYIKHKNDEYPFASVVRLWEIGLIPSFDGTIWRLHGGKKAKILFEISKKDLKRYGDNK